MFYIGQIFENDYPPEAAIFCNENNAYIEEIGKDKFEIKAVPAPTYDEKAEAIRRQRDELLAECDWSVLPDSPLSESMKAEYLAYRQALRDVPQQSGFPDKIEWPVEPGKVSPLKSIGLA